MHAPKPSSETWLGRHWQAVCWKELASYVSWNQLWIAAFKPCADIGVFMFVPAFFLRTWLSVGLFCAELFVFSQNHSRPGCWVGGFACVSSSSGGWLTRAPQVYAGDKPKTLKHVIYVKDVSERPKTPKLRHVKDECQHVFFAVLPKKSCRGPARIWTPACWGPLAFTCLKTYFQALRAGGKGWKCRAGSPWCANDAHLMHATLISAYFIYEHVKSFKKDFRDMFWKHDFIDRLFSAGICVFVPDIVVFSCFPRFHCTCAMLNWPWPRILGPRAQ